MSNVRRDLDKDVASAHTLRPFLHVATTTGSSVDLLGFNKAFVIVHQGSGLGSNTESHAFRLEESDDNVTFTTVPAASLSGTAPTLSSGSATGTVTEIGYLGSKRYIRGYTSATGVTSGTHYSAIVVKANPRSQPN